MDWMQFVSALVSATAWPIAVVIVICLLKDPILGLIPKIRSFKYGELHVDLTEQLKSLQEDLPAKPIEPETKLDAPPSQPSIPVQLAAESPRAAMIVAWFEVEKAVNEVGESLDREGRLSTVRKKVDKLLSLGVIDLHTYHVFLRASKLRNEAIHMTDREVDFKDAVAMAEICDWLVHEFHSINEGSIDELLQY